MKKFLIVMLSAVAALTSCQKSDTDGFSGSDMVDFTISASMDSITRSAGDGTTVDRCIMEIYTEDGDLYKSEVSEVDNLGATFSLQLALSMKYNLILWADASDGTAALGDGLYDTSEGLMQITTSYDDYVGNDEKRDAFYYSMAIDPSASTSVMAAMTRPFGQLNVKSYLSDLPTTKYPDYVSIEYTTSVGNTFNASTGEVSGEEYIVWSAPAAAVDATTGLTASPVYYDLSTEYLFASADEQDLHNFTMTFYTDADGTDVIATNSDFTNIPVQRNYKTTASGELLTNKGTISVSVTQVFTGTNTTGEVFVADIDELNSILTAGVCSDVTFYVTSVGSGTQTITIPENCDATSISINVTTIDTDAAVAINGTDYAGDVYFYSPTETQFTSLTVSTPYAHVEVEINASTTQAITSATTFVILSSSTIGTVTVDGGNVTVHGTVTSGDGIIISADNTTTTAIDVYGTVSKVAPAESYTTTEDPITITFYDEGTVTTVDNSNSDFAVEAVVSEDTSLKTVMENDLVESITLSSNVTLTGAISITKPMILSDMTFDGDSYDITMEDDGQFVIQGDVTMTNLDITASTTQNKGVIFVDTAGVDLVVSSSEITYNTKGNSSTGYKLNNGVIVVAETSGINNVSVVLEETKIYFGNTYQTAVSFMPEVAAAQEGHSLTMTDCLVQPVSYSDSANLLYSTGLSLGSVTDFKFSVTDSDIIGLYYPFAGYQDNVPIDMDIDIEGSTLSGYAALFLRGSGGTINIKDSTLTGRNYNAAGSNNFATIVYGTDSTQYVGQANNIYLTLDGTTIENYNYNTSVQYGIDVRYGCSGNTIEFVGNCVYNDEIENADYQTTYMIWDRDETTTIIGEENIELNGKSTLRLLNWIELKGEGTVDSPYLISEPYELNSLYLTTLDEGYYKLTNDIDLTDYPIGKSTYGIIVPSGCIFDGNNCTVKNLVFDTDYLKAPVNGILFYMVKTGGTVKNLNIENSSITIAEKYGLSYMTTGGLVGYNYGLIENCTVDVDIDFYDAWSTNVYCGGIVGILYSGGTIEDCEYKGTITKNASQNITYAGGFVGYTYSSPCYVTDCHFSGSINGDYTDIITSKNLEYVTSSGITSTGTVNGETVTIPTE